MTNSSARVAAASNRVPGSLRLPPLRLLCRRWRLPQGKAPPEKIGPWEIEATFKGDKFDRCFHKIASWTMISWRAFVRTGDDLALQLESAELEARSRQDVIR